MALLPLLLYASLGELVAEKSGVANLGIEGLMLMAALSSFTFDYATKNPFFGIVGSLAVVAALGFVFSFLTITLNVDQIVAGLGIYLFGLGLSGVLYAIFTATAGAGAAGVPIVPKLEIPLLAGIPFIGPILFQQNIVVYISLVLVPVTSYLLTRTGLGLRVRAVGENPRAADTMGINVSRVRYFATMTGVVLAGVSGAYLAVGYTGSFQLGYTLGRGFIALAMVYLSNWNPYKAFAAIFVYDFVDSLQSAVVINTPALESSSYLLALLPYIFVLVLIPVFGRKARAPKYLTIPYRKD